MIEKHLLLAEFKSLMETKPEFCGYEVIPISELVWLGKAHALVQRWNSNEAIALKSATDFLGTSIANQNINKIHGIICRAIADLELQVQSSSTKATGIFGPGAVYDFFKELSGLVSAVKTSLFVVDPYMDENIFDAYVSNTSTTVKRRLMFVGNSVNLKTAASQFITQHGGNLELRKVPKQTIHDRIIIVDLISCWILGQSIKDAAAKSPTYLAPLSSDLASLKISDYEAIWNSATVIYAG